MCISSTPEIEKKLETLYSEQLKPEPFAHWDHFYICLPHYFSYIWAERYTHPDCTAGSEAMHLSPWGPITVPVIVHLWLLFQWKKYAPLLLNLYFFRVRRMRSAPSSFWKWLDPFAGTSTPPGISATAVPSIATPIGVNGFSALPPQTNGQPTSEPIYTNGIHPYPGELIKGCIKEHDIHFQHPLSWDCCFDPDTPWHSCLYWHHLWILIILLAALALHTNVV